MKDKLIRFMYGRYGTDSFTKFLMGAGFGVVIVSIFFNSTIVSYVGWAFIIYAYFRVFSKNHPKRYAENQAYLKYTAGIRTFIARQKHLMAKRKTHRIYGCPSCKQKIRVPKGKGKIEVRCPKCSTTFIKRS